MNNAEISSQIAATRIEFINALEMFSDAEINVIPFSGSWTPGQVTEHVLLSANGVINALNGITNTAERDPAMHVELLKSIFLNYNTVLQSPDFILPATTDKQKNSLLHQVNQVMGEIEQAADNKDLFKICSGMSFPTLGKLSGLELTNFIVVHTQRHIHQLKKIREHLNKKSPQYN